MALIDPPWPDLVSGLLIGGDPKPERLDWSWFSTLRAEARRSLVAEALDYTGRYTQVDPAALRRLEAGAPLVVSGHQPELFHPGVWFKNFALEALAQSTGGVGVHLLIDSDLARETSVRVPTGPVSSPRVVSVRYDEPTAATPHEQRAILDAELFATFPDRVVETLHPLIDQPLVPSLWRNAREAQRAGSTLGGVLSELRHRLEIEWGSQTLEVPISRVADSEPFHRFVAELLLRSEQVAQAYNGALAEYRHAHRLRSAAQPLPNLSIDGHGCESPLWVWSDGDPIRRPLFVTQSNGRMSLSDRAGWSAEGPADAEGIVEWLGELRTAGVKIRSRALVTTLYARLVLSDRFLHGIGGAKYDQVTDRFAERLWGTPPPYATLSATLRLPITHEAPGEADRLRLVHRLRELRYHPEGYLPPDAGEDVRRWAQLKADQIRVTDQQDRRERHAKITEANQRMQKAVAGEQQRARAELEQLERGLRAAAILDSREYSFCLFPAEDLRGRLHRLAKPL